MYVAVIDTESGLVNNSGIALDKQPHVIEFYGCIIDESGAVIRELGFLCNPEVPIEKDVVRITGITDAMVAKEKPFRERVEELQDFFLDADAVVGHNLFHDMSVLNFELQRCGVEPALFWPEIKICTVECTEHLRGYRLSLSALHELLFNQGFSGAHRAKNDVAATVKIFIELVKRGIV
jgi:DNA polymerase III subunit epsilon